MIKKGARVSKIREFLALDKRSIALFRFSLGLIVFFDSLDRIHDAYDFYSDAGVFPREATLKAHWNDYWVSLHMLNGSTLFQQFLFLVNAIFGLFLAIGYHTRLSSFMCWFLVSSHQARNNIIGHGGDAYIRIALFWSNFLPLAAVFSVDRAFFSNKKRTKRMMVVCGGGIALIAQICIIYIFSYLHKTGDEWHVEGSSTQYALMLDYFRLPMGSFVLLFPTIMKYLSFGVLYYELWGAFLFFVPVFTQQFRTLAVFLFIAMHIGFGSCMGLGIFSPTSCTALAALLPSWFWDECVFRWLSSNRDRNVKVLYYKDSPGEPLSILVNNFFLLPDSTTSSETNNLLANEPFAWMAVEREGVMHKNFEAFEEICHASPILFPVRFLLQFPLLRFLVRTIFFSLALPVSLLYKIYPYTAEPTQSGKPFIQKFKFRRIWKHFLSGVAIFLIFLCFLWNCGNKHYVIYPPASTNWIIFSTRLDQMWNMFSPGPPRLNWWYTIEGLRDDTSKIEIWRNGLQNWKPELAPFSVAKPESLGDTVGNHRWIKFYEFFNWGENLDVVRLNFGRYLCREWNKRYRGTERLWKYNIIFHREENILNAPPQPLNDIVFWGHECYDRT